MLKLVLNSKSFFSVLSNYNYKILRACADLDVTIDGILRDLLVEDDDINQ